MFDEPLNRAQTSELEVKKISDQFSCFIPLENTKNFRFIVFSCGIKWDHWPEMG